MLEILADQTMPQACRLMAAFALGCRSRSSFAPSPQIEMFAIVVVEIWRQAAIGRLVDRHCHPTLRR